MGAFRVHVAVGTKSLWCLKESGQLFKVQLSTFHLR